MVVLPLDDAETAAQTLRDFRNHLTEIRPTLLLFLHRLRRLELVDAVSRTSRIISREPRGSEEEAQHQAGSLVEPSGPASSDIIALLDETSAGDAPPSVVRQDWLVVRELLDVKVQRDGVQSTEVALGRHICLQPPPRTLGQAASSPRRLD